ncbi:MAG: potassium channel family protein [Salinigranum sp.]
MAVLPVEFLYGLYLGVLVGIVPALVAWALGFGFRYLTGVTVPGFAVVGLSVAIAGAQGGLLALTDPSVVTSANQARLTVALLVVLMGSLYTHSVGDRMAQEFPRKLSLRSLTERTLSTDVVELVGGRGQVRVTVSGEVGDLEGYPPMPADLRTTLRSGEWTFPADLPLPELETRVADRLRTEYDLAEVSVRLDERARATVSAAPPVGAVSRRVPSGRRAVSVDALVPTGLARGDEVTLLDGDDAVDGTVVSATPGGDGESADRRSKSDADGGDGGTRGDGVARRDGEAETTSGSASARPLSAPVASAAAGGEGRVTIAAPPADARRLLAATPDRLLVNSRGVRREFELVSLLRRAGQRFRRFTVREGGALDGVSLGDVGVRDTYGVAVLAVRHGGAWTLAPRGDQRVAAGDEVFAVGATAALSAFEGAVA